MSSYYAESNDESVKMSKKGLAGEGALPDDASDAVLHMLDVGGHTAVDVDSMTVRCFV